MKIIVGLSGGVDSSVSALLLQQQGHEVEAVFMKNWDDDSACQATEDYYMAQQVCSRLKIKLHHINFSKEYKEEVFNQMLDQFQAGFTPNPDILCNQKIKFNHFYHFARKLGADYLATGHYAKVRKTPQSYQLVKSLDSNKDQTYFLYTLNQAVLPHILFPIGNLTKQEVRRIAEENHLPNHDKKDSTGICFIGEQPFKPFLNTYLLKKPGDMVDTEGKLIGKHDGIMFYTLGQRSGLEIGGLKGYPEKPWYVIDKIISSNTLVVGQDNHHPKLLSQSLMCDDIHFISGAQPTTVSLKAKIRYRQADQDCQIEKVGSQYKVNFNIPQRAITPGQSIVFYEDDICLGGSIIQAINAE